MESTPKILGHFVCEDDELVAIHLPNIDDRRIIHGYLDYFNIKHTSILCEELEYETNLYWRCCNKNQIMTYHYGQSENNQDEWYSCVCCICGGERDYECNYDYHPKDIFRKHSNNMIVIGKFIQTNERRMKTNKISNHDEIENIIVDNIYKMKAPAQKLTGSDGKKSGGKLKRRKLELGNYIYQNRN